MEEEKKQPEESYDVSDIVKEFSDLPAEEPVVQPPTKKRSGNKTDLRQDLFDWLQLLVLVLVCIIGMFTFVVSVVGVDGSSMYPTLHNGDLMLVRRIAYQPEAGDVIVLRKDNTFDNRALVKRIIATGGQTVTIDYDNNTVTVDGQVLDEPYLNYEESERYGDDFLALRSGLDEQYVNTTFTVPEGYLFVCGDNRNFSSDSRSYSLGMVDERYVIGEVLLIFWPYADIGWVG
jgi:signal peptidase I